jgi:hypothetical protein
MAFHVAPCSKRIRHTPSGSCAGDHAAGSPCHIQDLRLLPNYAHSLATQSSLVTPTRHICSLVRHPLPGHRPRGPHQPAERGLQLKDAHRSQFIQHEMVQARQILRCQSVCTLNGVHHQGDRWRPLRSHGAPMNTAQFARQNFKWQEWHVQVLQCAALCGCVPRQSAPATGLFPAAAQAQCQLRLAISRNRHPCDRPAKGLLPQYRHQQAKG